MNLLEQIENIVGKSEFRVKSYCSRPGELEIEFDIFPSEDNSCDKCCDSCCDELSTRDLHSRPFFVISSTVFNTLEDALDQLREWMEEGTLDVNSAIYRVVGQEKLGVIGAGFVISSSEFDSFSEAQEQIYQWHKEGILSPKARIFETNLNNCFELQLNLVKSVE